MYDDDTTRTLTEAEALEQYREFLDEIHPAARDRRVRLRPVPGPGSGRPHRVPSRILRLGK